MKSQVKKILMVTPYFPPSGGGLERYAYEIAKRLQYMPNYRVVVITSGEQGGKDSKEIQDGITVYHLSYTWKISNTPFSLRWLGKIKTILREEMPDVVNIHMPVPGIGDLAACVIGTTPLVLTYHTGTMVKKQSFLDACIWLYEHGPLHLIMHRAQYIVASSEFIRTNFLRQYRHKSTTITPAVDTTLFTPRDKNTSATPEILFVAGLSHFETYKGLKRLLEAMRPLVSYIPELKLKVVGEGNRRAWYEAYTKELGLAEHIEFTGKLTAHALVEAYQHAHVLVLPTYDMAEGFGMVLIEAMACKTPVIGTNRGGIPTIIRHEYNGLLVEEYDQRELITALLRIIEDRSLSERLAVNGYSDVQERFNWDVQAERYASVFSLVLHTQAAEVHATSTHLPLTTHSEVA